MKDCDPILGEVAERLKAQHWKCCLGVTLTRVRIPPSPLSIAQTNKNADLFLLGR